MRVALSEPALRKHRKRSRESKVFVRHGRGQLRREALVRRFALAEMASELRSVEGLGEVEHVVEILKRVVGGA